MDINIVQTYVHADLVVSDTNQTNKKKTVQTWLSYIQSDIMILSVY